MMLSTYLNDNQAMPYPFYGFGALPFPMSCITGLGVCLTGDSPERSTNAIFVSSIIIAEDSVRLALCRKTGTGIELIGMFYANTSGYYTYIPSYIDDAVYEDQTITPQMLRFVYSDFAPDMIDTTTEEDAGPHQMDWDDHMHEVVLDNIIEDMQVFYSYVKENIGVTLGEVTSNGYIQLGTIPPEAVGMYSGEFYLDPSCVTYMPDNVYGYIQTYKINNERYKTSQQFYLAAGGLLKMSVDGSTIYMAPANDEVDTLSLTEIPASDKSMVTMINGHLITGSTVEQEIDGETTSVYVYPYIDFVSTPEKDVSWDGYLKEGTKTDTVVITLNGGTDFPNCYQRASDD